MLIEAVLTASKSSKSTRNDFAHNLWGTSPDVPDKLILIEPEAIIEQSAAVHAWAKHEVTNPKNIRMEGGSIRLDFPPMPVPDTSRMWVYSVKELEATASLAEHWVTVFNDMQRACSKHHPDDEAHQRLLNEPLVAQVLERLSRGNGK